MVEELKSGAAGPILVDVEPDPRACPERRRRGWVWLPIIAAVVVLGVGLSLWLSAEDELRIEPLPIKGLSEEPSFAWQMDLPEGDNYVVAGEAVVTHPYVLGAEHRFVASFDIATGEEQWRNNYAAYVSERPAHYITARDLATGEMLWRWKECGCLPVSADGVLYVQSWEPAENGGDLTTFIERVDLETGSPQWKRSDGVARFRTLMPVGDALVYVDITTPDDIGFAAPDIPGVETCVSARDIRTGELGSRHCYPIFEHLSWPVRSS